MLLFKWDNSKELRFVTHGDSPAFSVMSTKWRKPTKPTGPIQRGAVDQRAPSLQCTAKRNASKTAKKEATQLGNVDWAQLSLSPSVMPSVMPCEAKRQRVVKLEPSDGADLEPATQRLPDMIGIFDSWKDDDGFMLMLATSPVLGESPCPQAKPEALVMPSLPRVPPQLTAVEPCVGACSGDLNRAAVDGARGQGRPGGQLVQL